MVGTELTLMEDQQPGEQAPLQQRGVDEELQHFLDEANLNLAKNASSKYQRCQQWH